MPNWAPRPLLPQTKTALSSRLQSLTRLFCAPLLSPLNTAVISFYRASGCRCLSATSRKESAPSGKSKQTAHRQSARSPHCQNAYRAASSTVGGLERVPASARFQDTSNFFHHLSCPEIKWPARLIRREKLRPQWKATPARQENNASGNAAWQRGYIMLANLRLTSEQRGGKTETLGSQNSSESTAEAVT